MTRDLDTIEQALKHVALHRTQLPICEVCVAGDEALARVRADLEAKDEALRLVHEQDCNCDNPGGPKCYSQSIGEIIAAGSGSVTG